MRTQAVDVCVVGAGLSGANTAWKLLEKGNSVAIVDARHRVGGRLLTAEERSVGGSSISGCGDLGGAWVWPRSEYAMRQFLTENGVETVPQHIDGRTVARTQDGRRHVLPDGEAPRYAACGGGASRIVGGAASMARKLLEVEDKSNLSVELGMKVTRIDHAQGAVTVTATPQSSDGGEDMSINCKAAILAAPPKVLASTIEFHPQLPKAKYESMLATPTWMEDYGKVLVSFPRNWWRDQSLSAVSIDQVGAVSTWWEACSGTEGDGRSPALAGFVTGTGAKVLRKLDGTKPFYDYIIDSLSNLYGVDAVQMGTQPEENLEASGSSGADGRVITKGPVTITYKSWLEDPLTNARAHSDGGAFTTDYGDRTLQQSIGPLFFAGTETAYGSGHMDGAIVASSRVVDEVMQHLEQVCNT